MKKKKAAPEDNAKTIGIILADVARTKAALSALESRVAGLRADVSALSDRPRRRLLGGLLARLFGR